MAEALQIQEEHLKQWESILKPEVFAKLRELVTATNATVTDPHDVCRGTELTASFTILAIISKAEAAEWLKEIGEKE
jgi:hypothetical protein